MRLPLKLLSAVFTTFIGTSAYTQECRNFNRLDSAKKIDELMFQHGLSAGDMRLGDGGELTLDYVQEFVGNRADRVKYAAEALHATSRFLGPAITENSGFHRLEPTLQRDCD